MKEQIMAVRFSSGSEALPLDGGDVLCYTGENAEMEYRA